jgi:predicted nucleotidyltransferase
VIRTNISLLIKLRKGFEIMDDILQAKLKERYDAAVNSFISKVKDDPNIIAVIVSGSLAYDVVWEKSDIDMTVVVRDQILKNKYYCIIEDGITINAELMTRSDFKRGVEREIGGSFSQSYLAKGKIVYTTDDSLCEYFEDLKKLGSDDIALSIFYSASMLIDIYDKCQKWLTVRMDPLYAQYYLLKAAEVIANMELCLNGEPASRASIQRALELNPVVITPFYQEAMSHNFSDEEVLKAIEKIDKYLEQHLDVLKKPVIEFMSDQQIKTSTLIAKHFHIGGHFIVDVFDYLVEKGVIEKVSQTIRITPKSKLSVEELGYLFIP